MNIPTLGSKKVLPTLIPLLLLGATQTSLAIDEIVVTAQKREQSVQDVSVAITAFSGDDLRELGVTEPVDLAAQTPGVDIRYSEGRTNPIITIRGVGLNDNRPNNNPSTAVHIDEVYLSSAGYLSNKIFDVERVEVLKGPQGTLYGRNSTAGTINFVTVKPSQEFSAFIDTSYGNFNSLDVEGAIGGGLSETLSGRLAFNYVDSDGYVTNKGTVGLDGFTFHPNVPPQPAFAEDDKAGNLNVASWRAALLFEPTDNFDALLSVHGSRDDSANNIWALSGPDALVAFLPFADVDGDPHERYEAFRPELIAESYGGFLRVNYELDFATLTSISGYEEINRGSTAGTGSPFNQGTALKENDLSQYSQEVRLTSNGESDFQWIAGAIYAEENADVSELLSAPLLVLTDLATAYRQEGKSWAVFGHTDWQFAESLKLTVGLRYTEEDKSYEGGTIDLNPYNASCTLQGFAACLTGGIIDTGGPVTVVDAKRDYSEAKWSGKIGIDWQVNDDTLVYTSVSNGFKSGGIDGSSVTSEDDLTPFDSEVVMAYEAGLKLDFADGTSRLNVAAFYYDYEDIQVQATVVNPLTNIPNSVRTNAGEASVAGAEVEWLWQPIDGLSIGLGASYLDSEIKTFNTDDPAEREQFEGNRLADAPEFTFNGLVRYEWALNNGMQAAVMTDFNYNDETFKDLDNSAALTANSYSLINGRLSLTSADDRWEVALWGKNLGDKEYRTSAIPLTIGSLELPGAPRTYGVTLRYQY